MVSEHWITHELMIFNEKGKELEGITITKIWLKKLMKVNRLHELGVDSASLQDEQIFNWYTEL